MAAWSILVFVTRQLVRSHVCCLSKDSTDWKLQQLETREQGGKLIPSKFWKMGKQKDKLPTELGLVLIQQRFPLEFFYRIVLFLQFGRWKCRELRMWILWDSAFVFQSGRVVCCLTWLGCKYFAPELLHWSNQEIKLRSSGFSQLCANNVKIWLRRISPISWRFSLLNCSILWEDHLNQYRIRNQV